MRVVTLNMLGHHRDWPRRLPVVRSRLRQLNPDVLTLQEAVVTAGYDQVAEVLGDGYHLTHHPLREKDGSGISIASRWPIGTVRELDLQVTSRTVGFAASAQVADVHWPHTPVLLLLVNHKPSYQTGLEEERGRQAVITGRVVEELVEQTRQHVILAGDMDAMPEADSIRFWRGVHTLGGTSVAYRDAWQLANGDEPGHTFAPSRMPLVTEEWRYDLDRRIDYIFVRCEDGGGPALRVRHCTRILDLPFDGIWGSDHFGVLADMQPPPGLSPSAPPTS